RRDLRARRACRSRPGPASRHRNGAPGPRRRRARPPGRGRAAAVRPRRDSRGFHLRYGSEPMPIDVKPVSGFSDLREFVALPPRLPAGPPGTPPLKLERYAFLTRKLNSFFTHGEAKYFLARRDGRVVGRV